MKPRLCSCNGFSLLEVLVALAIMAVAFTTLLGIQSSAILSSERAESMTKAVMLARQKLTDLEMLYRYNALPKDDQEELRAIGTKPFGDAYPQFGYALRIRKTEIPIPQQIFDEAAKSGDKQAAQIAQSAGTISEFISDSVREVRLRVFWELEKAKIKLKLSLTLWIFMQPLSKFNNAPGKMLSTLGFSLLEITVAIMILSIMVTLLWTTLGQSLDVQERSRAIDERQLEVRSALDRMAREVGMAFILPTKDPTASSVSLNERNAFVAKDNNDRDRLDFSAFAHLKVLQDAKESDQAEISYYTEIKGSQIHLFRRESPLIDGDPQAGGKTYVLLENINKFNVTYNDLKRGQWTRDWDTRTIYYRDRLPAQVEISLEYFNSQGNLEVLSTRTLIYAMDALQW